jgi:hypothetical protein
MMLLISIVDFVTRGFGLEMDRGRTISITIAEWCSVLLLLALASETLRLLGDMKADWRLVKAEIEGGGGPPPGGGGGAAVQRTIDAKAVVQMPVPETEAAEEHQSVTQGGTQA